MRIFRRTIWFLACLGMPLWVWAQPVGYAVNSDEFSFSPTLVDELILVNLQTGTDTVVGPIQPNTFEDIEGLAIHPDGTLYAVDDSTNTLVILSTSDGSATAVGGFQGNLGIAATQQLDPGMTFTCAGDLLMAGNSTETLYRIDQDTGLASIIGASGALGAGITGIASFGDQVYGISDEATAALYEIDPDTGTANMVLDLSAFGLMEGAGLAFDDGGTLWAVTDQGVDDSGPDLVPNPSRILQINPQTGDAAQVASTRNGLESLAIGPPGGCGVNPGPSGSAEVVPTWSTWAALLCFAGIILLARRHLATQGNE